MFWLAWLEGKRAVLKAAMLTLGMFIVGLIAAAIFTVAFKLTSAVQTLLGSSNSIDTSIFSVANSIIPLTEIMAQIYLVLSCRVALIVAGLVIAPLKHAWSILSKALNAGE